MKFGLFDGREDDGGCTNIGLMPNICNTGLFEICGHQSIIISLSFSLFVTTGTLTKEAGTITRVSDEGAGKGVFQWSVDNFSARRAVAVDEGISEIYSPPFQHPDNGYRMRVKMLPNGDGRGKDSHMSLYFTLLPGQNDNHLEWPYTLSTQLSVLHPGGDKHCSRVIDPTTEGDERNWGKPAGRPNDGCGWPTFLAHRDLHQYLNNDQLTIQITIRGKKQA